MTQLPKSLSTSSLVLGALLLATLLVGCRKATFTRGPSGPVPDRFVELEPNDSPDFPDFVGFIDSTSFVQVDGFVEAVGVDIVDHIEFESAEPIEVEFFLEALDPFGDVDVSIYDPVAGVILGTFAAGGPFESGTIIVQDPGRPFQFVISAFAETTSWSLELRSYPHFCNCRQGSAPEQDTDLPTELDENFRPVDETKDPEPSPILVLESAPASA